MTIPLQAWIYWGQTFWEHWTAISSISSVVSLRRNVALSDQSVVILGTMVDR